MTAPSDRWPALDHDADRPTLEALHMQAQVVGKVKLSLTATAPQWQNLPLTVNARGLTTGLLDGGSAGVEVAFDLIDHRLVVSATDGREESFPLRPRPLREFTAETLGALDRLGVPVTIHPMTVEVPNPVRCDECDDYDDYEPDVVQRFFRALTSIAPVLERFRAGYWGKQGTVNFWWGTFDLAVTRFDLTPVPATEGMDVIHRVGADSAQASVGFWPGDDRYGRAAFFAYTHPKPQGLEQAALEPDAARWSPDLGEFLLDYQDVRAADDPAAALLSFAESAYAAGADLAGWNRPLLERRPPLDAPT